MRWGPVGGYSGAYGHVGSVVHNSRSTPLLTVSTSLPGVVRVVALLSPYRYLETDFVG